MHQVFSCRDERVYDAWLDPVMLGQWMFGSRLREERIIHFITGKSAGDSFSFLVERDGNQIKHVGQYLEMVRQTRLVFSWDIGSFSQSSSRVIVDIGSNGSDSSCLLSLTHRMDAKWREYADRTRQSLSKMLFELAEILDQNPGK